MTGREVRRHILIIQGELRGDILRTGQVRLRLHGPEASVRDIMCDTLEDMALYAATEPGISATLYEQLLWELDLLGLRGE